MMQNKAAGATAVLLVVYGASALTLSIDEPLPATPAQDCRCLNFREVLDSKKARCGDGMKSDDNHDVCQDNMTADTLFNTSFCLKASSASVMQADEPGGYRTWCYVNPRCRALNGGKKVGGGKVSLKYCTEGERLGDLSPVERWQRGLT